ncbi:hypothetical protein VNO77_21523 [Canavalia gladiata]|uniref:Uncharacterized protein n=1 Tax=Canavalia gladiata TaxID=3824 RepID=A0AAN9LR81_CANGL
MLLHVVVLIHSSIFLSFNIFLILRGGETNSVVTAIRRKPPPAGDAPARDGNSALEVFRNKTNSLYNSSVKIFDPFNRFSVFACNS